MKRIGILSENYNNDSQALKALLEKKFSVESAVFLPILKGVSGSDLENLKKLKRQLSTEVVKRKLEIIILFTDLDDLPTNNLAILKKQNWSVAIDKFVQCETILLLAIFELESIILADIETFNELYKAKINFKGNPLLKTDPKGLLKQKTEKSPKKYAESHAPEIFQKLNFQTVYNNHQGDIFFQTFINELEKSI